MNTPYQKIAARIRAEIADLERVVNRIAYVWPHTAQATADQNVYLESVALNLHGFYSGLEKLFELIAKHIDQNSPQGEMWHRDLLRLISQPTAIRPDVISPTHIAQLDEFRRFRHIVRNVYSTNLQADKMVGLISTLPQLWGSLKVELLAFADFLDRLTNELNM